MGSKKTITRLDAARRQLCLAIRLFFSDGDIVSTHTLTCAAHEILSVLTRHSKDVKVTIVGVKGSMLFDNPFIRPEWKKRYIDTIKRDYNFFKHSGKNPSESIEFDPDRTEFFLFDAVCMHHALNGGRWLYPGFTFFTWFAMRYPDTVQFGPMKAWIEKVQQSGQGFATAVKRDYLELLDDEKMLKALPGEVDIC